VGQHARLYKLKAAYTLKLCYHRTTAGRAGILKARGFHGSATR